MIRPLFLFRPEPGWTQTATAARDMGLTVAGQPILTVEPVMWDAPQPGGFDAILAGSANAFRFGGSRLHGLAGLPVYAVGKATADAARVVGLSVEQVGKGGLQSLLDTLAGRKMRLLRLGGEVRVPLAPPHDITLDERAIYRTVFVALKPAVADQLVAGGVVALHSGEAARHFSAECNRLDIARGGLALIALAPRIAELAGGGWQSIHIASTPSDGQLLALAQSLCQRR